MDGPVLNSLQKRKFERQVPTPELGPGVVGKMSSKTRLDISLSREEAEIALAESNSKRDGL
jgi:hypothetical protein